MSLGSIQMDEENTSVRNRSGFNQSELVLTQFIKVGVGSDPEQSPTVSEATGHEETGPTGPSVPRWLRLNWYKLVSH